MACTMYSNTEQFRLVDVDEVLWSNPNYQIIPEPSNFGSIQLTLDRNIEDRGGANFEFGQAETSLGFDKSCRKSDILEIINQKGVDANIILEYYHQINNEWVLQYSGYIVPSSMSEVDYEVDFRVKRTDFGDSFRTRFEVQQGIDGDIDLDGGTISTLVPLEIGMHSQGLSFNYQSQIQDPLVVSNVATKSKWDFGNGEIPSFGFVMHDTQYEVADNIGTSLNIQTYPTAFIPVNVLWQSINGGDDYTWIDEIRVQGLYNIEVIDPGIYTIIYNFRGSIQAFATSPSGFPHLPGQVRVRTWARVYNSIGLIKIDLLLDNQVIGDPLTTSWLDDTTFDASINQTVTLEAGDRIHFFTTANSSVNMSGEKMEFTYGTFGVFGSMFIDTVSTVDSTICKGVPIYEALNRLIQKAVGTNIEQFDLSLSNVLGAFVQGDEITSTGGGRGVVYGIDGNIVTVIGASGVFVNGNSVTTTSGGTGTIDYLDAGNVIESKLIGRITQGEVEDGCAAWNYITNGLSVRGFTDPLWDSTLYYRKGDKVTYQDKSYEYIFNIPSQGNLPTNTTYWKIATFRKISTSIKKIMDFLKFRYGAGFAVVKTEGLGYGTLTDKKVTRILIEEKKAFFQDKLIMTLPNVQNPINKKINKNIIYNEIQVGYSVFAEPNEAGSIGGFNTIRNDVSPIQKEKKKLGMVVDACTDGQEIERLRRATVNETSNESDDKDEETMIVKCRNINIDYPYQTAQAGSGLSLEWFAPDRVRINGMNTSQIEIGDKFIYLNPAIVSFDIVLVLFNEADNRMVLEFSAPHGLLGINNFPFYINNGANEKKEVFLPERVENITNIVNAIDSASEYNMDHAPTNFLISNFDWYGSAYKSKDGSSKLIFTSGKNNYFFGKAYRTTDCNPTTDQIVENQDFELSVLRSYNPEIFTEYTYDVDAHMSYSQFISLKQAMINEAQTDINYGYVEFIDNEGNLIQGYPMKISYNPLSTLTKVLIWGKA